MTHAQQQASAGEVPEWALLKAFNLTYSHDARDMSQSDHSKIDNMRGLFVGLAFARYIAAHEPAPVDPLEEVVAAIWTAGQGYDKRRDRLDAMVAVARARGVTVKGGE